MIRAFKLRAGSIDTGAEYNFFVDRAFIYKPTGLGFAHKVTTAYSKDGNYIVTNDEISQPAVGGEIVFTRNPYVEYKTFIDFVKKAKELYLGYNSHGTWYFLKGYFSKIEKTEIALSGQLRCKFTFNGVTLWRSESPIRVNIASEHSSLTYDLIYDFIYGDDYASGTVSKSLDGHVPGAVEIVVNGEAVSPVIALTDPDGNIVGRMVLSYTIPAGHSLFFSTVPNEAGVWDVNGDTRTDLISHINLEDDNFFGWPVDGKEYTLSVTIGGSSASATVTIYEYFESV